MKSDVVGLFDPAISQIIRTLHASFSLERSRNRHVKVHNIISPHVKSNIAYKATQTEEVYWHFPHTYLLYQGHIISAHAQRKLWVKYK